MVWWQALAIGWVCLFIYAPAYRSGWSWDDDLEITRNAALPNPAGLISIWTGPVGADYLPLKSTIQWLLWRLFGMEPAGYHLVNVALHLASALLLWRLFSRLHLRYAWIGGLLFAAHPVFVETVMWVAELKSTLSLLFLLGAMLAWLDFDERRRRQDYIRTLLFYLAALLSKSAVVMFPAVILLYGWWKRGRISRREMMAGLPCFVLSAAISAVTIWFQLTLAIRNTPVSPGGVASHLALAGLAIAFYLGKLLLPIGLLPMYPRWTLDPPSLQEFVPWLFLTALLAWSWSKRAAWGRHVLFGLGFFLLNVLPVLGFFKMSFMRVAWVSDHLIYLPAIGLIGLTAAGAGWFYDRYPSRKVRPVLLGAGLAAVGSMTFVSHRYALVYAEAETLWNYTLLHNPDAWGAHLALTLIQANQGHHEQALAHAIAAERLRPDLHETQNNLSIQLAYDGSIEQALLHAVEAHRLAPWDQGITLNCGFLLFQQKRYAEALKFYTLVAESSPDDAVAHYDCGVCLFNLGKVDDAIAQYRRALALDPNHLDAKRNLEIALRARDPSRDAAERGFAR